MSHATQLHNRGYLADYMQIMNRCALPSNVQDEVYRQGRDRALATVKSLPGSNRGRVDREVAHPGLLDLRFTEKAYPDVFLGVIVEGRCCGACRGDAGSAGELGPAWW